MEPLLKTFTCKECKRPFRAKAARKFCDATCRILHFGYATKRGRRAVPEKFRTLPTRSPLRPLTPPGKGLDGQRIITYLLATRDEWWIRGKVPKEGAVAYKLPHIPRSAADLHIKWQEVFCESDMVDKPPLLPEPFRYEPRPEPLRWTAFVFAKDDGSRRPNLSRILDKYKWVHSADRAQDNHTKAVPDRIVLVYPGWIKYEDRRKRPPVETKCLACERIFIARLGAKTCSPACRKWLSRQPTQKPENN
jgi:hypothetical protein